MKGAEAFGIVQQERVKVGEKEEMMQ